ncbi:hypothetical protein CUZ56_01259 [Saezia sanguinis]|uniref:Uncharacterized protein n=1 Tax=Saezia sanguinis TaxID=1965230 RepID=A0A433SF08_9BURK|nr:hypothetical protein CUZ56_01259 [Saezia sanguinis]
MYQQEGLWKTKVLLRRPPGLLLKGAEFIRISPGSDEDGMFAGLCRTDDRRRNLDPSNVSAMRFDKAYCMPVFGISIE